MKTNSRLNTLIPALVWTKGYGRETLYADLLAGIIVTLMLIPQSLAYALLAGMPAHTGLYASILPLLAYAVFGSSRTLSVGPVAVVSLMTLVALQKATEAGATDYLSAAIALSLLTGAFLLALGLLKLGFIANFLSHTVISGFITASGIIIALSQLKHILGISSSGSTLPEIGHSLITSFSQLNSTTLLLGGGVLLFLFWAKSGAPKLLAACGVSAKSSALTAKAAPVIGVVITIGLVWSLNLSAQGVAIVGEIPKGLPTLVLPTINLALIQLLWIPALSIAIIGYVESIAVGKTLAAKRREKIDPNQELIGLGTANIASAFSGAFPVTGGISRSIVNFDAGAITQAASIFAAIGIALASLFLTPFLYYLPKATLAATIIVAVFALIDFSMIKKTWQFSRRDFSALTITLLGTLLLGVEVGVACGVLISLMLHLYHSSKPHIAEVGLIENTEHFRNVKRFEVITKPNILSIRVDESLFFANASYLEDFIHQQVYQHDEVAHVILMCTAINEVDFSALEVLESINQRLKDQGVYFHLSEVKGPVMDSLRHCGFEQHLSGQIFLSQFEAFKSLSNSID